MGLADWFRKRPAEPEATERALSALLLREAAYDTPEEFFAAIARAVPAGKPLPEGAARLLVTRLRGYCDGYGEQNSELLKQVEALWAELARRTDDPFVCACHAETLLARGKKHRAVQEFFRVFAQRPELLFEFGGDLPNVVAGLGEASLFEYRLLHLRALLESEADDVRELYSELLDEYADDPEALARLHKIGAEIEAAVLSGKLPRALVRRGASRRDRTPERPL